MSHNDASRRPLLGVPLALAILVFGACGGAASPSAAPIGGASQAAASQAAPSAAASLAATTSNAPVPANSSAACGVITASEVAKVQGKPVGKIESRSDQCRFITDGADTTVARGYIDIILQPAFIAAPLTVADKAPLDARVRADPRITLVSGLGDWAASFSGTSSGKSIASFQAYKGTTLLTLLITDDRNTVSGASVEAPLISDARVAALKALMITALTRI